MVLDQVSDDYILKVSLKSQWVKFIEGNIMCTKRLAKLRKGLFSAYNSLSVGKDEIFIC